MPLFRGVGSTPDAGIDPVKVTIVVSAEGDVRRAPGTAQPVQRCGRHVLSDCEWRTIEQRLKLSPRELAILQCLFDDQSEGQAAHALGMSVHTVHTHLGRLYHKLGVSSRVGAVVRAFGAFLGNGAPRA